MINEQPLSPNPQPLSTNQQTPSPMSVPAIPMQPTTTTTQSVTNTPQRPSVPVVSPPPPPAKKSIIMPMILGILFILLICGVAAGYFYWQNSKKIVEVQNEVTPTPTEAPPVVPITISQETDSWNTFTSGDIPKIVFKYPSTFVLGSLTTEETPRPVLNRKITWGSTGMTSMKNQRGDGPVIESQEIATISGITWTKYKGYQGEVGGIAQSFVTYETITPDTDTYYQMSLWELPQDPTVEEKTEFAKRPAVGKILPEDERVFDKILTTFKFVQNSASTVDTSSWKTIANGTYGYYFDYPEYYVHESVKPASTTQKVIDSFKAESGDVEVSSFTVILSSEKMPPYIFDQPKTGDTKLGGQPAVYVELPKGYGDGGNFKPAPMLSVDAEIGGFLYQLTFNGVSDISDTTVQAILNSFKFTN